MADPSPALAHTPSTADPSARLLVRVIRASLGLTADSVDSLTTSQLLAVQAKLRETLSIIDRKIQQNNRSTAEDQKVVIDLSDWDDSSDDAVDEEMEIGEEAHGPPRIPGPYPTDLPPGQEVADAYYVVDHGREVGIFTDNVLSTRAVTGVACGHQIKVKTWYDAATHYNTLWDKGVIIRVRP